MTDPTDSSQRNCAAGIAVLCLCLVASAVAAITWLMLGLGPNKNLDKSEHDRAMTFCASVYWILTPVTAWRFHSLLREATASARGVFGRAVRAVLAAPPFIAAPVDMAVGAILQLGAVVVGLLAISMATGGLFFWRAR